MDGERLIQKAQPVTYSRKAEPDIRVNRGSISGVEAQGMSKAVRNKGPRAALGNNGSENWVLGVLLSIMVQ